MVTDEEYGEEGYAAPGREHYTASKLGKRIFYPVAFVIGATLGAITSLLLAPGPGRETRERIKEASQDVKEKAETLCADAVEKVSAVVEKGRGLVQEGGPLLKQAVEAGKKAYDEEKAKLKRLASGPDPRA
jgi:gas vesicle protein